MSVTFCDIRHGTVGLICRIGEVWGGSPTRQDGDLSSRSLMGQYDQYGGAAILTSYSHVNREPDDIPRDFGVPYLII